VGFWHRLRADEEIDDPLPRTVCRALVGEQEHARLLLRSSALLFDLEPVAADLGRKPLAADCLLDVELGPVQSNLEAGTPEALNRLSASDDLARGCDQRRVVEVDLGGGCSLAGRQAAEEPSLVRFSPVSHKPGGSALSVEGRLKPG
jgi:hypothetical protein